jgi:hypothetical protein
VALSMFMGGARHRAAERVDFAHQVTFTDAADCWTKMARARRRWTAGRHSAPQKA